MAMGSNGEISRRHPKLNHRRGRKYNTILGALTEPTALRCGRLETRC
jgi:hypothetical protein